jgi:phosphoserine phosphatase
MPHVCVSDEMKERQYSLVVFDLDGTLAEPRSGWVYLHSVLGTMEMSKGSEDLYFSGKISWEQWAERDVKLWTGAKLEKVLAAVSRCPLNPGAKTTVETLRKAGYEMIIISAGLHFIGREVGDKLGISRVYANELVHDGKSLTGEVKVRVTATNKGEILKEFLKEIGMEPSKVVAVGDDFTMIPLFKNVGLSIAFNPINLDVEKNAMVVVKNRFLTGILPYILNYDS